MRGGGGCWSQMEDASGQECINRKMLKKGGWEKW